MSKIKCSHCKAVVQPGTTHHCNPMRQAGLAPSVVPQNPNNDSDDGFIISAIVGYATGDEMTGTLVGGDLTGATIGAALSEKESVEARQNADGDDDGADSDDDGASEDSDSGDSDSGDSDDDDDDD